VLSTYESRHAAADAKPFQRGINSFQPMFDGHRWGADHLLAGRASGPADPDAVRWLIRPTGSAPLASVWLG